jgi:hypothetical protein
MRVKNEIDRMARSTPEMKGSRISSSFANFDLISRKDSNPVRASLRHVNASYLQFERESSL